MGPSHEHDQHPDQVRTDLVEYLIITVSDLDGLTGIGRALDALVRAGTVRVLDVVALASDTAGLITVVDLETVPALAALRPEPSDADLLSEHDLELSSRAIPPGAVGVVVVTEDRWAESLSVAASQCGGAIVAGDRIPARRVEAALDVHSDDRPDVR